MEKIGAAIEGGEIDASAVDIQELDEPTPAAPEVTPIVPDPLPPVVTDAAITDAVEEQPTPEEAAAAAEAADEAEAALPDDATDEEREAARAEAEDEFYAGTYKTREEAEKGIAEQNATITRLFAERDQALRAAEEAQQQPEEPDELDVPAWDAWAQSAVENGEGHLGAIEALKNGGYEGYQLYMRHWLSATDENGDPDARQRTAATLFNNDMILEIAEVRSAAAAQAQRQTPSATESLVEAQEIVRAKYPDLDNYGDAMAEVITGMSAGDTQFLRGLAESGLEGKARAIEMVLLQAKTRGPNPSARARQVERQRRASSADAATLAATTSSAEGAPARTPPPETEQIAQDRKAGLRARQSLPPLE